MNIHLTWYIYIYTYMGGCHFHLLARGVAVLFWIPWGRTLSWEKPPHDDVLPNSTKHHWSSAKLQANSDRKLFRATIQIRALIASPGFLEWQPPSAPQPERASQKLTQKSDVPTRINKRQRNFQFSVHWCTVLVLKRYIFGGRQGQQSFLTSAKGILINYFSSPWDHYELTQNETSCQQPASKGPTYNKWPNGPVDVNFQDLWRQILVPMCLKIPNSASKIKCPKPPSIGKASRTSCFGTDKTILGECFSEESKNNRWGNWKFRSKSKPNKKCSFPYI